MALNGDTNKLTQNNPKDFNTSFTFIWLKCNFRTENHSHSLAMKNPSHLSGVNAVYLTDCRVLTAMRFLPTEAGGDDNGLGKSRTNQPLK